MFKTMRFRPALMRLVVAATVLAAGVVVATDFAEARIGRSGSIGSRGARTWSTPAPTPTAPSAAPMQRSATQPGATQPGVASGAAASAARPGFFNRPGFMGGLMGGLLGAGLFGLLMGGGFFSGLGSLSGILGFILQAALIFIVFRLVMGWIRSRNQPSYAGGARPDPMQRSGLEDNNTPAGNGLGGGALGGGALGGGAAAPQRSGFGGGPRGKALKLEGGDFDNFERILADVQTAYGSDDRAALGRLLTPEMQGYIGEELDELARDGLVNKLSDVKLLQGDLSEAWTDEDGRDYATVAMRYQIKDVILERATDRVVQGDADRPVQVVEFWTFVRNRGGEWTLSAIQQG